jgi:hypothetical protein
MGLKRKDADGAQSIRVLVFEERVRCVIHRGRCGSIQCSDWTPFESFLGFLTFGSPADLGLRGKRPVVPWFCVSDVSVGLPFSKGVGFSRLFTSPVP